MLNKLTSYMIAYPDRFNFSDEERTECIKIVDDMIRLAGRITAVSRASLEENAYQTELFFLRKALYLYIDNAGTDISRDILETYIVYGGYKGKELLEKLIILEGILSVYRAENPSILEERLKAYLGEKLVIKYDRDKNLQRVPQPSVEPPVFVQRNVIKTEPINQNRLLTQKEIDDLVKSMLDSD